MGYLAMRVQDRELTLQVVIIVYDAVFDMFVRSDAANVAASRCTLDLHRLAKFDLETFLPVVKRQSLMDAPPSKPGATAVLGTEFVDVDAKRVVLSINLCLLPLLTQILRLAHGGGLLALQMGSDNIASRDG